jgi:hypothetical protein
MGTVDGLYVENLSSTRQVKRQLTGYSFMFFLGTLTWFLDPRTAYEENQSRF